MASPGPGRIWDRVAACCDVDAHSATNPIPASNPCPALATILIPPPLAELNYSFRPSSQDIFLEIPVQQPGRFTSDPNGLSWAQGNRQEQPGRHPPPSGASRGCVSLS